MWAANDALGDAESKSAAIQTLWRVGKGRGEGIGKEAIVVEDDG